MNSIKQVLCAASLATTAFVPAVAQAQSAVISQRSISFAAALEAAKTGLEACQKGGYVVTVTVLGRHGRTLVVLSDDNANPHTIENSFRKAYTSLTFRRPSGEFGKAQAALPAPHGAMVLLVKPQFEAGRDDVGRGGIVRDPAVHARVIDEVTAAAAAVGLKRLGLEPSPIEGAEGNREFLLCLALV